MEHLYGEGIFLEGSLRGVSERDWEGLLGCVGTGSSQLCSRKCVFSGVLDSKEHLIK